MNKSDSMSYHVSLSDTQKLENRILAQPGLSSLLFYSAYTNEDGSLISRIINNVFSDAMQT